MKSFYSIIVTLGCLISSGSYAMAPRERNDIERDRETTPQDLLRLHVQLLYGKLLIEKGDSESFRSFLEEPASKIEANLVFWHAVAKGMQQACRQAKEYVNHNSTAQYQNSVSATGKFLTLLLVSPVSFPVFALISLGAVADLEQASIPSEIAKKYNGIGEILHYLSREYTALPGERAVDIAWTDERNEHVIRIKQLIDTSNHQELKQYLTEHRGERAIQANIRPLQQLAITVKTREEHSIDNLSSHSFISLAGTIASSFTGIGTALTTIIYANGGGVPSSLQAMRKMRSQPSKNPSRVLTILQKLRTRIPDEEIQHAQQQLQREALQRQLAQVEQEREEAEIRLEEERTALRPLIDEAVRTHLAAHPETHNVETQT